MPEAFHYPPEVMSLLIDTVPLLCRSKQDVFLFFKGAGVRDAHLDFELKRFQHDKNSVNKYGIVREVLTNLNKGGDADLAARREVLKRIAEFEDFSTCWPGDILKAKGLVSEIRRVVHVKDSFTQMRHERDAEREKVRFENERRLREATERRARLEKTKQSLYSLFGEADAHKRGRLLEPVLNGWFADSEIGIREAFVLRSASGSAIEQIDGVIELDGNLYLVEMKWYSHNLGVEVVAQHLVRVFSRGHARGILLSATEFTDPAIDMVRESLQRAPFILMTLEEIVYVLEQQLSLRDILRIKVQAAMLDKEPFSRIISRK